MVFYVFRGNKKLVGTSFRTRIWEPRAAAFSPVGTSFRTGRKFKGGARKMWLFTGGDQLITNENAKYNKQANIKKLGANCKN